MNPIWRYGLAAIGLALGVTLLTTTILPFPLAWLLAINLVALGLYRYDKSIAGSDRTRVPEIVLLLTAAAGGVLGAAVAMWLIHPRHKVRSIDFLVKFAIILGVQIAIGVLVLRRMWNF